METDRRSRVRDRLLDERKRALDSLRAVQRDQAEPETVTGGNVPRHPDSQADTASDTLETETDFLLAERESARISDVDDALKLLAAHPVELFRCRSCGREVERERLELIPWSRVCAACARGPVGPR